MDTKEITVSDLAQEQIKNAERLFPLIRKKQKKEKQRFLPSAKSWFPTEVIPVRRMQ